jgi:hypothetical protein
MVVPEFRDNSLGCVASVELCSAFNLSFWGGDYSAAACVSLAVSSQK